MGEGLLPKGERINRNAPRGKKHHPIGTLLFAVVFMGAGLGMAAFLPGRVEKKLIFGVQYFGILFGLCGFAMFVQGLRELLFRRRHTDGIGLPPWERDRDWNRQGASDDTMRTVRSGVMFVIAAIAILAPMHYIIWKESLGVFTAFPFLIMALFDIIIMAVAGYTIYLFLRRMKFGSTRVEYLRFPCLVGDSLRVRFHGGPGLVGAEAIQADLLCVHEYMEKRSNDDSPSTIYDCLWRESASFRLQSDGSAMIEFAIPHDVWGTDFMGDETIYWELELRAELPGVDYGGVFLVPVYTRP